MIAVVTLLKQLTVCVNALKMRHCKKTHANVSKIMAIWILVRQSATYVKVITYSYQVKEFVLAVMIRYFQFRIINLFALIIFQHVMIILNN